MGSTYDSLHLHWVCATKGRRPFIQPGWRSSLHEYLGVAIRGLDGVEVGGAEDHVHSVFALKTTQCVADFVRELKKS